MRKDVTRDVNQGGKEGVGVSCTLHLNPLSTQKVVIGYMMSYEMIRLLREERDGDHRSLVQKNA